MAEDRLMNGQAYAAARRPPSIRSDGWVMALAPPCSVSIKRTAGDRRTPFALAQAAAAGAAPSLMSAAASPSHALPGRTAIPGVRHENGENGLLKDMMRNYAERASNSRITSWDTSTGRSQ
jgi:hypothetical protein